MIIVAGINLILLFFLYCRNRKLLSCDNIIYSMIYSIVTYIVSIYFFTEIASIWKAFNRCSILLFHGGMFCILLLISLYNVKKRSVSDILELKKNNVMQKMKCQTNIIFLILVIIFLVLMISMHTIPYNMDSMAYRLPRIMQWLQNGTIDYYASNYLQQIETPILTEVINAHIYVLTGCSETAFNLLQTCSYLLNCLLVYKIAELLKCNRLWCYIAVCLFAATPIAFAEAFSSQSDNFSAVWMLFFIFLLLKQINEYENVGFTISIFNYIMIGLITGIAYETKPNVIIPMLCFGVYFEIACIMAKIKLSNIIKYSGTILGAAILVMLPELIRIYMAFNTLFPEMGGSVMLVQTWNPKFLLMNLIKGVCYNLNTSTFYFITPILEKIPSYVSNLMGVEVNSSFISWDNFILSDPMEYNHDRVPNPLITWLFMISLVIILVEYIFLKIRKMNVKKAPIIRGYMLTVGFIYFCFITVNRFSRNNVRYQLPLYALLAVLVVCALGGSKILKKRNYTYAVIIASFCAVSLINQVVYHFNIALTGVRDHNAGYFIHAKGMYEGYKAAIAEINKMDGDIVGLHIETAFEYPLYTMLDNEYFYQHVNVDNETQQFEDLSTEPDFLIYISSGELDEVVECHGRLYYRSFYLDDDWQNYAIYQQQEE